MEKDREVMGCEKWGKKCVVPNVMKKWKTKMLFAMKEKNTVQNAL
jgi:hypothetical protein